MVYRTGVYVDGEVPVYHPRKPSRSSSPVSPKCLAHIWRWFDAPNDLSPINSGYTREFTQARGNHELQTDCNDGSGTTPAAFWQLSLSLVFDCPLLQRQLTVVSCCHWSWT